MSTDRRGTLEALDRILNRGGEPDDVLRQVVALLSELYDFVGISFVEAGTLVRGPSRGVRPEQRSTWPIAFRGTKVGELEVASPEESDEAFLERVAILISAYCLVGWDTAGEPWEP
jgi:hypothetical protein